MSTKAVPLAQRVSNSYLKLSSAALSLNTISNELGKLITNLDSTLKKQSPGIEVWVAVSGNPEKSHFIDLGYAKIHTGWHIAIRSYVTNSFDDDRSDYTEWPFNDAPRDMRLAAVDRIPDLLDELSARVDTVAQQIKTKITLLKEVVSGIQQANGADEKLPWEQDEDMPF